MLSDAQSLATIERRIGAVSSVRQVVQLMWMLARSQLAEVEAVAESARAYVEWVDETVGRLAGSVSSEAPSDDRTLHVVFGPERGYCAALRRHVVDAVPATGRLGLVGHQLVEAAVYRRDINTRVAFALGGPISAHDHEAVAYDVAGAILEHGHGDLVIVHYPVDATGSLRQTVILGHARTVEYEPPETFSPVQIALDIGVRELAMGQLAVAGIQTLRAEVRTRIAAAERARTGCERRLDELSRNLSVVRQSNITGELMEIVAGHVASAPR